jgi:hypothetical protein
VPKQIELGLDGCREVAPAGAEPPSGGGTWYDSLHSLLINTSAGYKQHFHEGLRDKLAALVARDDGE